MNLLVITTYYQPDGGPSAPLYAMLCEALVRRGCNVTVIAAVPHYPTGRVLENFKGWRACRSVENDVEVIRVPVPSLDRSNLVFRMIQFLCFQVGACLLGLRRGFDVLLVSNPALEAGLPFAVLAVLRRKPAVFSVHDVYPDAGVTLGIFRHRAVIAMVAAMERFCLYHSARVRILSESFVGGLKALGTPDEKMVLIYDWVDTNLVRPLPRKNSFSQTHNLDDRFVVLYAGNLGLSQGLDTVLKAARHLKDKSDVLFLFVGDGAGRSQLQAEAAGMSNVHFLPYQSREHLPEMLASADVSLVVLKRGIGSISLPSKLFSILASGRPVLASVDENSDTCKLIHSSQAGLCVEPENPEQLADAILSLRDDPSRREKMGLDGRTWAEKYHSPQSAAEQFEQLFAYVMRGKK